jgi:hypothetical protein
MKKALGAMVALALALPGAAQQKNDEVVVDEAGGVSLQRPPKPAKGENLWKCQAEGRVFSNTKACVTHVMDDLSAEIVAQMPEEGKQWSELKTIGKNVLDNWKENLKPKDGKEAQWKDFKSKTDEKSKFPAAGNAYYIEGQIELPDGGKKELREYIFIKNDILYRFVIMGFPGKFKEKERDMMFIMSAVKFFKPPKRK